jgi:hypothetical protein
VNCNSIDVVRPVPHADGVAVVIEAQVAGIVKVLGEESHAEWSARWLPPAAADLKVVGRLMVQLIAGATLLSSNGNRVISEYSLETDSDVLTHSEECGDAVAAGPRGCVQIYGIADGFPMLDGLDQAVVLMWE